ncbi:oxidoreductase-like domain-containing protein [Paraburkholderia humisilvae]|uniref:oxidoreductase-like domain-containing protein n=1 Tax=Paraburkholderia humisilvae TaxID=627669 RepID=UPI001FE5CC9A|nr:oxidoreductase-like domain-containing protein [Paraburkholderia humisilvae]
MRQSQRNEDPAARADPPPVPPTRPSPDDCCRSGCDPCVFDLYNEALERYDAALAEWETRHGKRAP